MWFIWQLLIGSRRRIDANGQPAPFDGDAARQRAADLLASDKGPPRFVLMTSADEYYYPGASSSDLPVVRVELSDDTRFYLDPDTGSLRFIADDGAKGFRIWHMALHTFDFLTSPLREILLVLAMLGVTAVCGLGAWMGVKKLARGGKLDNIPKETKSLQPRKGRDLVVDQLARTVVLHLADVAPAAIGNARLGDLGVRDRVVRRHILRADHARHQQLAQLVVHRCDIFLAAADHKVAVRQAVRYGGGDGEINRLLPIYRTCAVRRGTRIEAHRRVERRRTRQRILDSVSSPSRAWTPVSVLPVRLRAVVLFSCAKLPRSRGSTVRMSPILLARWSLKNDFAPARHSEFGACASTFGVGSGMETRCDPAIVAGFEIAVSCGGAIASLIPAQPPSISAARPAPVVIACFICSTCR